MLLPFAGLQQPSDSGSTANNSSSESEEDGGADDEPGEEAVAAAELNPDELAPPALVAELQKKGSGTPEHPFTPGVRTAMNRPAHSSVSYL